jgi:hypothetical protein
MRLSLAEHLFQPIVRLAPQRTWTRFLWLLADVALFNLVFYQALRSVLLQPLGLVSLATTVGWLATLVVALVILHGLKPRRRRMSLAGLAFELLLFGTFLALVAYAADLKTTEKGFDYSWLRIEVIKVPLWFEMFGRTTPGFTAAAIAFFLGLAWRTAAAPTTLWLRLLPGPAVGGLAATIARTFTAVADEAAAFYVAVFSAPLVFFWALFASGASVLAFRSVPFVLHATLIALTYSGTLPLSGLSPEIACESPACGPTAENRYGVSRLYPTGGGSTDASFAFLRKMLLSHEHAFFSFGPTCGVYAVHRRSGELRKVGIDGLIRDMDWDPSRTQLWATNWTKGDFLALDATALRPICRADLFGQGVPTPWGFVTEERSGMLYLANVTPPIVAEIRASTAAGRCEVKVQRSIDFHANGYTRFTDGAFDLHVDPDRNRLYALVGMLDGRYEIGLVELELDSFRLLRDLRLPSGPTLRKIRGRDAAFLPSYYRDSLYEVSLDEMRLLRTIQAAPTITAIEQDEKRGLFYATSRTTGELLVIDDARGEVVRRFNVGAKPEALKLDPAKDELFVAGGRGVFRIDLNRFLPP